MAFNPFYWTRQGMQQGADMGFTPPSNRQSSSGQNYQRSAALPFSGGGNRSAQAADVAPTPAGQQAAPFSAQAAPVPGPFGVNAEEVYGPGNNPADFKPGGPKDPNRNQSAPPGSTSPFPDSTVPVTPQTNPLTGGWTSGHQYNPNPNIPPGTFGASQAGNANGTVFNPTHQAQSFYGNLLGNNKYTGDARYQPVNEHGGGFEQGQENLRTDIGKSFEQLFGKALPYQFSNYNFQMGDNDPQRQAYQMAHWFYGGPEHGWSPGLDRAKGTYDQAAQDELRNFQKAMAEARKAGHGTFPVPPGTSTPPGSGGGGNTPPSQQT